MTPAVSLRSSTIFSWLCWYPVHTPSGRGSWVELFQKPLLHQGYYLLLLVLSHCRLKWLLQDQRFFHCCTSSCCIHKGTSNCHLEAERIAVTSWTSWCKRMTKQRRKLCCCTSWVIASVFSCPLPVSHWSKKSTDSLRVRVWRASDNNRLSLQARIQARTLHLNFSLRVRAWRGSDNHRLLLLRARGLCFHCTSFPLQ